MATALTGNSSPSPLPLKLESGSPNTSDVAQFISKVWSIVNDHSYSDLVSWSESGKTFVVLNKVDFSKHVLPHYFKHNNFESFVRQLNLYGFRKVAKPDHGALLKTSNDSVEFWHANFRRNHQELLHLVQRRSVSSRTGSDEKNPFLSQVITDIHSMKGTQTNIEGMLNDLKKENVHLKQEITILKEKHKHQGKLLNKIIHFIVHLLYKGTLPTKRSRLMLTDCDDSLLSPPSSKRRQLDPPSPLAYSVQSPLGPLHPPPPPTSSSVILGSVVHRTFDSYDYSNKDEIPLSVNPNFPVSEVGVAGMGGTGGGEGDFLDEFLTSPLPQTQIGTGLVPVSQSQLLEAEPESALTLALQKQQQGIDTLKSHVPDQLSIDPLILTEFINSAEFLPEYDFIDTARLLESVSSETEVPNEETIQNALVPYNPQ